MEIVQKAERSRTYSQNKSPEAKEPSNQHGDEESILTHATIEHHTDPQAADEISLQIQNRPKDTNPYEIAPDSRYPSRSPPWRCDQRIYESRFVIFCFWGSQLGILSLTALFVVFYFELFVPLNGVPGFAKLDATLQTDYGIWFIVACTVLAWVGMGIFLLTGGACFSSLFRLEKDSLGRQEPSWECGERGSDDRVA